MRLLLAFSLLLFSSEYISAGQQITGQIVKNPGKPLIAVTDFRGSGAASGYIGAFNDTVRADLEGAPLINFVPKTLYPLQIVGLLRNLQRVKRLRNNINQRRAFQIGTHRVIELTNVTGSSAVSS